MLCPEEDAADVDMVEVALEAVLEEIVLVLTGGAEEEVAMKKSLMVWK